MKKLLKYAYVLLAWATLFSCQPVEVSRTVGKPGDGLTITFNTANLAAPANNGARNVGFTISGYVPEDLVIEGYGTNTEWSMSRTSTTSGSISTKKAPADTARVRLIAYNGVDIIIAELQLNGIYAKQSATGTFYIDKKEHEISLDYLKDEPFQMSISPKDADWISFDGLNASVKKNDTDKTRSVTVTLSHPSCEKPIKYLISQKAEVDYSAAEIAQYETKFNKFVEKAKGKTHSDLTPMGKHYENARAVTSQDKAFLKDSSREPDMSSGFPNASWVTMSVNLYPFKTPSPADINQHLIGDCCLCAVLAEMAFLYPDFIKSIIKDNGDNTYTVSMYDPKGTPISVTVSNKFMRNADGAIVGLTGHNQTICWSSILEKAVMKWENCFGVDNIGGIGTEFVAPLFTGNGDSFAFGPGSLTNAEMERMVDVMHFKRMIIIGGFTQNGVAIGSGTTVSGHAFSFFPTAKNGCLFAMRNPWGSNGDGSGDGVLNIPDDNVIPPLIDFRIVYPGAALEYAVKDVKPYVKPF